jgi:phosphoglycolate phosphatase-like HAD superfamily hydrolase
MRIEPVFLFDLDGTLVDSVDFLRESWCLRADNATWTSRWTARKPSSRVRERMSRSSQPPSPASASTVIEDGLFEPPSLS